MATLASRRPAAPAGRHPARPDDRDDGDRHLERLVRRRRARLRDLVRRGRRDRQPDHRRSTSGSRTRPLARRGSARSPPSDPSATEVDLAWAIVEEMSRPRGAAPAAGVRGLRRPRRAVSRCRPIRPSSAPPTRWSTQGVALRRPGAEHHRQVPGHDAPASRAMEEATLPGRQRQRHGLVQRRAGRRRGRGGRARPAPARGRRPADRRHGPGDHDHDGPARGLAARVQTERDGIIADPTALPWSGVAVFKRAYAEFRERGLPGAPARRRDPPPPALVGADRRRRRHHDAGGLAAPLQRVVGRGPAADRRPGRPGHRRRAADALPGLRAGLRARRPEPSTSSTRSDRRRGRCARSSARTTSCSTRSPRRWSRTPTSARLHDRAGHPSERPAERPAARPPAAPARRVGRGRVDPARPAGATCRSGPRPLTPAGPIAIGGTDHETAVVLVSGRDAVVAATGSEPVVLRGSRRRCSTACRRPFYLPAGASRDGRRSAGRRRAARRRRDRDGAARPRCRAAPPSPSASGPDDVARRDPRRRQRDPPDQPHHRARRSRPTGCEVVEVLTPSGNWSSWPPHKHDVDDMPRRGGPRGDLPLPVPAAARPGASSASTGRIGSRDATLSGRSATARSWSSPTATTRSSPPHGDDAYYLNALAGDRRTMACSFDPALDHVRSRWSGRDPRPASAAGRPRRAEVAVRPTSRRRRRRARARRSASRRGSGRPTRRRRSARARPSPVARNAPSGSRSRCSRSLASSIAATMAVRPGPAARLAHASAASSQRRSRRSRWARSMAIRSVVQGVAKAADRTDGADPIVRPRRAPEVGRDARRPPRDLAGRFRRPAPRVEWPHGRPVSAAALRRRLGFERDVVALEGLAQPSRSRANARARPPRSPAGAVRRASGVP